MALVIWREATPEVGLVKDEVLMAITAEESVSAVLLALALTVKKTSQPVRLKGVTPSDCKMATEMSRESPRT